MTTPRTLFDKIWDAHVVAQEEGGPAVLYVDLHLIHEVTSPQAFTMLRERGLPVRRPERTVATMDHATPTDRPDLTLADAVAVRQLRQLAENCAEFGIRLYDMESAERGIVHVLGPEQGLTQPGMTIVCGDSHTSTHGAFGALAFGIGTSEVAHVLASQCLLQARPKTFLVNFEGELQPGVTAKDMILALIARIGVGGGKGHVFEYAGSAVRALSMEERMTLCNMSIEAGARAGLLAPGLFDRLEQALRIIRADQPAPPAQIELDRVQARHAPEHPAGEQPQAPAVVPGVADRSRRAHRPKGHLAADQPRPAGRRDAALVHAHRERVHQHQRQGDKAQHRPHDDTGAAPALAGGPPKRRQQHHREPQRPADQHPRLRVFVDHVVHHPAFALRIGGILALRRPGAKRRSAVAPRPRTGYTAAMRCAWPGAALRTTCGGVAPC